MEKKLTIGKVQSSNFFIFLSSYIINNSRKMKIESKHTFLQIQVAYCFSQEKYCFCLWLYDSKWLYHIFYLYRLRRWVLSVCHQIGSYKIIQTFKIHNTYKICPEIPCHQCNLDKFIFPSQMSLMVASWYRDSL